MPSERKLERLVFQLIRDTTEGDVAWELEQPPRTLMMATDDLIEDYFETTYKGQSIAVFERRFRAFDAENDVHFWTAKNCLAFLAENRSPTWETSEPTGLTTLLRVAKESAVDVDRIIDSLLD